MNLKELSIDEIHKIKDVLINEYIGDWDKPQKYYDQMTELDNEIILRKYGHINIINLDGSVYFGRYKINFDNGYVTFIYGLTQNDGTHKFENLLDLLSIVRKFMPRLRSNEEFLDAVRKLAIK